MDTVKKDLIIVLTIISIFVCSLVIVKIYDNKTGVIEKIGNNILQGVL